MKNLRSLARTLVLGFTCAGFLAGPVYASESTDQRSSESSAPNLTVTHNDVPSQKSKLASRYEGRSQHDKQVASFEGGGAGVYIGGSTAAIVLLLVILIVVL